ncbi:MAG: SHOCT domain-containing protein [Bacteroidales bacterium]
MEFLTLLSHGHGVEMESFPTIWIVIIAVIIIIALVVILSRTGGTKNHKTAFGPEDSPMDMLKKRYAGGDISKEEFEEIKEDLQEESD